MFKACMKITVYKHSTEASFRSKAFGQQGKLQMIKRVSKSIKCKGSSRTLSCTIWLRIEGVPYERGGKCVCTCVCAWWWWWGGGAGGIVELDDDKYPLAVIKKMGTRSGRSITNNNSLQIGFRFHSLYRAPQKQCHEAKQFFFSVFFLSVTLN